jgi:hypothetical protein
MSVPVRFHRADVVLDPAQTRHRVRVGVAPPAEITVYPFHGRAVADGGRKDDFLKVRVQAIPVIHVAGVCVEIPHGLHVGVADRCVDRLLQRPELDWVERIDAPLAPVRPAVHPRVLLLQPKDGASSERDDHAVRETIARRQRVVLGNLRHDVVSGKARIRRARDEEAHVQLGRHLMRRRGRDDRGRITRMQPIAARMADGAVDADALEADPNLGEADRHLVPIL